jgi:hypothetical protein
MHISVGARALRWGDTLAGAALSAETKLKFLHGAAIVSRPAGAASFTVDGVAGFTGRYFRVSCIFSGTRFAAAKRTVCSMHLKYA